MNPADRAEADQIRAAIKDALLSPCTCGECVSDEDLNDLLDMDDETLLAVVNGGEG